MERKAMMTKAGTFSKLARGLVRRASVAVVLGGALVMGAGLPSQANPFDPVVTVNGRVITQYELDQRLLFLQILRQAGDLPALARSGLIEDRLRQSAAKEAGIAITAEQVMAGMTEFASRANLTAEEFVELTGQMGLDAESFRDFVDAGMVWREVVRTKFAGQISITDAEIDRAIANFQPTGAVKHSLGEISFPAEGGDLSGALARARQVLASIETEADFQAAARSNGGSARGWQPLSELPEKSRLALAQAAPGTLSNAITLEDRVVIYWLYERGEDPSNKAAGPWLDYAQYLVPEGATAEAELAAVRARVDNCDDLYTVAKGLPADRLTRETQPQASVGGDVGAVLATLDAGESSTRISRGGWRVFLMLCSRGPAAELVPSRDIIREQLLNQRLSSMADIYLEELRSEAIIVEK